MSGSASPHRSPAGGPPRKPAPRPTPKSKLGRKASKDTLALAISPSINAATTPDSGRRSGAGFGAGPGRGAGSGPHNPSTGFGTGAGGAGAGAGAQMPSRNRAGPQTKRPVLGPHGGPGRGTAPSLPGARYPGGRGGGGGGGGGPDVRGSGSTGPGGASGHGSSLEGLDPLGNSDTSASEAALPKPGLLVEDGWGDTQPAAEDRSKKQLVRESWDMSDNGTLKLEGLGEIKKTGIASMRSGGKQRVHVPLNIRDELILFEELGRGASGVVRKALHLPTLQLVAVKHVRIFDQNKRHQMVSELKALYKNMVPLSAKKKPSAAEGHNSTSPHLVEFYDAYTKAQAGIVSIVMEYMSGGSLQELLGHGPLTDEAQLSNITRQVLKGLAFLHKKHQLHRDIKPANILRSFDGTVKLADFGISRELDDSLAKANTFIGTLIYMAPERIESEGYSYASDVWAVGLSVMALALGKFPYSTSGGYWALSRAIKEEPVPIPPDTFSAEFKEFVRVVLTKDPAKRPSAAQLLEHPWITKHSGPKAAAPGKAHRPRLGSESKALEADGMATAGPKVGTQRLDEARRGKGLEEIVKVVMNHHFELFRTYFQRKTRRKHIRMTQQDLQSRVSSMPLEPGTKLVLSIDDVRILAAQLGLPALVVRRTFNDSIKRRLAALHKRPAPLRRPVPIPGQRLPAASPAPKKEVPMPS